MNSETPSAADALTGTATRDLLGGQIEAGATVTVTETRLGWFVIDAGFGVRSTEMTWDQITARVTPA